MGAAVDYMQDLEAKYYDITALYDLAEDLLATVEAKENGNPDIQLKLVESVIANMEEATDILTESFLDVAQQSAHENTKKRSKIETAFRQIYTALHIAQDRVQMVSARVGMATAKRTTQLLGEIKQQVELCIAHFVVFVDLSLDRIMQKHEVEEIRKRQQVVAAYLHQQAMMGLQKG